MLSFAAFIINARISAKKGEVKCAQRQAEYKPRMNSGIMAKVDDGNGDGIDHRKI